MNLINKKLLLQKISSFEFPNSEKFANAKRLLEGWHKALKDSDLEKTKEKSVQGKFLSTFFEAILGYSDVTTGQEEWTLIQHPRIENDSKEPDGSLGWFSKDKKTTKVVIELKDAKTQLDKKQNRGSEKLTPIEQAYLYATKYEGCNWIIVSNFKEIRLYNKHRTQEYYERFDVIDLIEEAEFKRFYFLLSKETLISKEKESIIDVLAKNTTEAEQDITKKFYAEYKQIRLGLLDHLEEANPNIEKIILLEKAQKLLDRFIFTLFCEDSNTLLPLNIVKNTYERALNSLSPSDERVWTELRGLFIAIDKGNTRVIPPINAYNGGLFASDDILDKLSIKDEYWVELMKLADYDFETDLNVNILGHIFEQSISDLETIKESISLLTEKGDSITTEDGNRIILEQENTRVIEKTGRRKKDGIFYTPEHITKYIVENSVGKFLEEHPERLENIKILDPACGSGSILNQAHSFLLKEYQTRYETMIAEKLAKNESITLFDYNPAETNKEILLNNIFGVDLNQESVEISKLALWLKTARKTEPLQNLDKNIKCGNSLISDPTIAGEKAFNWNTEYEEIMNEGGFDVIVGNPPYVFLRSDNIKEVERNYYRSQYKLYNLKPRTDIYFFEKAFSLLKEGGYFSFIAPNNILTIGSLSNFRKYFLQNFGEICIVNIKDKVFEDANVDTMIVVGKKTKSKRILTAYEMNGGILKEICSLPNDTFLDGNCILNFGMYSDPLKVKIVSDIENKSQKLSSIIKISNGLVAYKLNNGIPKQTKDMAEKRIYHSYTKADESWYPYVGGSDSKRYRFHWSGEYIKYGENLGESRQKEIFDHKHLVVRVIPSQPPYSINCAVLDGNVINDQNYIVLYDFENDEQMYYICSLLNSRLLSFWFINKLGKMQRGLFPQLKAGELGDFPILMTNPIKQKTSASKAQQIFALNKELYEKNQMALEILSTKFSIKAISTTLKTFYKLGWNELITELEKQKIEVSLSNQEELQKWFDKKRSELLDLDNKIQSLDKEIDQFVYELYGLNEEEKKIVETSTIE